MPEYNKPTIDELTLPPETPANEKPLSQEELRKWFGDSMPTEVVNILFTKAGNDMTVGQVRAKVRAIAAELMTPESLLEQAVSIITTMDRHEGAEGWSTQLVDDLRIFRNRYDLYVRSLRS